MTKNAKTDLQELFVSLIILSDKHSKNLPEQIAEANDLLSSHYHNYEILVVDNHMPIDELSTTSSLLGKIPCIRIVRLSRQTTKDTAAFAGLESAIGDIVVILVANQDPISLVPKFVEKNRTSDIVFGNSKIQLRRGWLNRHGSNVFYWYNKKYLGIDIPSTSTYFMSLNRPAVNAATRSGRFARHIRYMTRQIGYSTDQLDYNPNTTKYPAEKRRPHELVISALEIASSYSKHPLRFVSWIGLGGAVLNLFYGVYVVAIRLFKHNVAEGWTTLSLQSSIMFFLLFMILAVLCEYVGKVLEESRNESPYHIMDELTSTVSLADKNRRNIYK